MISNSLITAGWLFFAAWSVVLAGLTVIAFGRDFVPLRLRIDPAQKNSRPDPSPNSRTR